MNINDIVKRIEEISLNHNLVKSFYIGNTWDASTGKGDVYPCVWTEFPVLIEYTPKQKTYTFSLNVLMLANNDDTYDEMNKQSQCEVIADQLTQAYQKFINGIAVGRNVGLTVKNINADVATGVRMDLQFITNRECVIENNFKQVMTRQ